MIRKHELECAVAAYSELEKLPSAHVRNLDDRTQAAIITTMAQLRVLIESLRLPSVVSDCGYSSPNRCPHSKVTG